LSDLWRTCGIQKMVRTVSIPLSKRAVASIGELPRSLDGTLFPVHTETIKQSFRAAVKRAGVKDFHFHDLRHEAVSRLFERGLSMVEVAAISGHKTLAMLSRYTHLRAEDLARKLN
jgi:integrase